MATKRVDAWRPAYSYELLVRAATSDGERATSAWEQWLRGTDPARLNAGAARILPLLYYNLVQVGIQHPLVKQLGVGYRHCWAMNQVVLHHLEQIVGALEGQGITTLVLKGAALMLRYYPDIGTRPMTDFDILVPVEQTDEAMVLLEQQGWRGLKPLHLLTPEHRAPFHGMSFHDQTKPINCDLHWHVMHIHLNAIYTAPMWAAAKPLMVGEVPSRVLCPEDQLIHLFFNGVIYEGGNNWRWLPDALMVLKKEPALDWDRVVEMCRRLEFVQPVAAILEYLRTEWDVPVPGEAIETLAKTRVSFLMRKSFECLNTPRTQRTSLQIFWLLYTQYLQSRPQTNRFFPVGFMQFLRDRWRLDGGVKRTISYAFQRMRGVAPARAREIA